MTSADSYGHTHTNVLTADFFQIFSHKLEDSLGFLTHFLTPHIGPDPVITIRTTSSFISIWYMQFQMS
jgi:hypothetical protein